MSNNLSRAHITFHISAVWETDPAIPGTDYWAVDFRLWASELGLGHRVIYDSELSVTIQGQTGQDPTWDVYCFAKCWPYGEYF
jgi:hypothetical protein